MQDNGPESVDPRIAAAVKYLKEEAKVAKIAVTGYCFGGRYAFRTGAAGKGADVVFAAHPSNLGDAEILAVDAAASIAAAGEFVSFRGFFAAVFWGWDGLEDYGSLTFAFFFSFGRNR